MKNIFISIIVPVYNVERYLRECLDSIVRLEEFSWEAILIDDGSTDSSGAICDEYSEKNHKFKVIHQKNAGVSMARNAGLAVAEGEWIWFVDSDDTINPDFKIVNFGNLEKADYVLFDMVRFYDGEVFQDLKSQSVELTEIDTEKNEFLCHNNCNHHQRIFYRKSLISNNGLTFSQGIRVGEDLEFQYKYLTLCKRPVCLNAKLYNYRQREGSATQDMNYRRKNVEDLPKVLCNILKWCKKKNISSEPWLEIRVKQIFQNLLYSSSFVDRDGRNTLQKDINGLIQDYRSIGFVFVNSPKIKIAKYSIFVYILLNSIYLKLKGLK